METERRGRRTVGESWLEDLNCADLQARESFGEKLVTGLMIFTDHFRINIIFRDVKLQNLL